MPGPCSAVPDRRVEHTLAIHPGALGDVLLAVPALRALRVSAPGTRLMLAAQPRLGTLLTALGLTDGVVDFESLDLGALFGGALEGRGCERIRRAERVVCWFGAGDETFVRSLRALRPDAVVAPAAGSRLPVWQHLRRTLERPAEGDTEVVRVPPSLLHAGRAALREAGWDGATPLVVLHPGAGGAAKRWPVEGFAAVAATLAAEARVVLAVHQGPADADAATALHSRLDGRTLRFTEPSLTALAGALRLAALWLGNDSGVSHLAAAVGARSVVLFTEALRAWRPWAAEARVVTVSTAQVRDADLAAVREAVRRAIA